MYLFTRNYGVSHIMVKVLYFKFAQLLLEVGVFNVLLVFCVPSLCYFHLSFLSVFNIPFLSFSISLLTHCGRVTQILRLYITTVQDG